MFSLFDETGIFIACCRHRMVVYGCDMRKSGELFVVFLSDRYKLNVVLGQSIL